MSPVWTQPSVRVSAVASGRCQYSERFITPWIQSSPVSNGAASVPSAFTAFTVTSGATARPQLRGRARNAAPPMVVARPWVSVMPQPVPGAPAPMVLSIWRACSGAIGAPPPPALLRLERSYLPRFGERTSSHAMVGTPLNSVMRSASMMRNASSTSHLYMPTTLRPRRNDISSCTTRPVTWNSGTVRITAGGSCGTGAARPTAAAICGFSAIATAPPHSQPSRALVIARWVESTPFGWAVEPDV